MPPAPALVNLSTVQLEYLDAVTRHRTWAAAAADLGVTPSALSQGIAELERRLGVRLFERDGRARVLRADAAEVSAYATRVLAQTRDLGAWLAERRDGRQGTMRLGLIDAAAVDHFPTVLSRFREERPDLQLRVVVAPSGQLLEMLTRGELDLAVCVEPAKHPAGLRCERLLEEPLALYVPGGATVGEPRGWGPWVCFPAGSHTRAVIDAALVGLGAPVVVSAESHQPEVLKELVRLGIGWAVLPVVQAERRLPAIRRARRVPIASRWLVAVGREDAIAEPSVAALRLELLGANRRRR